MENKSAPIFYHVAKPHIYDAPPQEVLCEHCGKVAEHRLIVFTCDHKLCAACWQKSAYNLYGSVNECAICKVPTNLVCYRDYWKFIAKNILERKCTPYTSMRFDLDTLKMYCSVEGCTFSDVRPKVKVHEKECWGKVRRARSLAQEVAASAASQQPADDTCFTPPKPAKTA